MIPLKLSLRRSLSHRGWVCRKPWLSISTTSYSTQTIPADPSTELAVHAQSLGRQTLDPSKPARTRFAPSPTGYLHLGSLRTALYNYLVAKATGGQFLLRIEDTDQKRTIADSEARLCQDLKWAGLQWDEGPDIGGRLGPYRQSERTDLYRKHAQELLDSGHAYRCFCSAERLSDLSKSKLASGYDRKCHGLTTAESDERASKGEAHVVRLLVPPQPMYYDDIVYRKRLETRSKYKDHRASVYEDPVLLKSDGFPTYHLANVVDDHYMRITHVIRGTEWMPSTPMHLALYKALRWDPPAFGHVGLLVNMENKKLSKRNGDLDDIASLRDQGYLPEAVINFASLLGSSYKWRPGTHGFEVMSLQNLIEKFKTPGSQKFTRGDVKVDLSKLRFFQKQWIADSLTTPETIEQVKKAIETRPEIERIRKEWPEILRGRDETEYLTSLIQGDAGNFIIPALWVPRIKCFLTRPSKEELISNVPEKLFGKQTEVLEFIETFLRDGLEWLSTLPAGGEERLIGHSSLRWALTAVRSGHSNILTVDLLGREEVVRRLELAAEVVRSGALDSPVETGEESAIETKEKSAVETGEESAAEAEEESAVETGEESAIKAKEESATEAKSPSEPLNEATEESTISTQESTMSTQEEAVTEEEASVAADRIVVEGIEKGLEQEIIDAEVAAEVAEAKEEVATKEEDKKEEVASTKEEVAETKEEDKKES